MAVARSRVLPFRPPQRRRLHEVVAEQLRDAILDGRFREGEKLPPERDLAAEFQVNRASIREAIQALAGLGLVRVRQGDGATVMPIVEGSLEVLPAMVLHGGRIDHEVLAEIGELLLPLLREMARLAVARRRPGDVDVLRALRDRLARTSLPVEERGKALRDIVVAVSDMTGNRAWQMFARKLRGFLAEAPLREARSRLSADPGRFVPVIDRYLDALAAGRGDAAGEALDEALLLLGRTPLLPNEARAPAATEGPPSRGRGMTRKR